MNNPLAIECTNLSKSFGKKHVLADLAFSLPSGSCCALLGRNGAGKSTLMRILSGLSMSDSGTVRVLGLDPIRDEIALKKRIGIVSEAQKLYDFMTLTEFCRFLAGFYPDWDKQREKTLIEQFHLPADRKLGTFSRGMYTKASLMTALCRDAELLLLDDPLLGLDPVARQEFFDGVLDALVNFKRTVLFTSHQIDELESVCDYAAILKDNRIFKQGSIDTLKADFHQSHPDSPDSSLQQIFVAWDRLPS